jgi:predicted RNA-binding protein with PUA-like domain
MAYWLVKSEPTVYSIDNLAKDRRTLWDGVRNYQARNFLKQMRVGEEVLFYHSSDEAVGIAGVARVSKTAIPDPTQFDKKSDYHEPRATKEDPVWFAPEIEFARKFSSLLPLERLKKEKKLDGLELLKRGSRLSVQPVEEKHFSVIAELSSKP